MDIAYSGPTRIGGGRSFFVIEPFVYFLRRPKPASQSLVPPRFRPAARRAFFAGQRIINLPLTVLHKLVLTPAHLLARRSWQHRKLEIGPGEQRITGFET